MQTLVLTALLTFAVSAHAMPSFYKGERISGARKVCLYDRFGGTVKVTVKSSAPCPLQVGV